MIILCICFCVVLGLGLLYRNIMNTGYNALTPEQLFAIEKLKELYNICVKYRADNISVNLYTILDDYHRCIKILEDPRFIESLKSLDRLNIFQPSVREYVVRCFERNTIINGEISILDLMVNMRDASHYLLLALTEIDIQYNL